MKNKDSKIKCGTFGNLPIPKEILKKMEADRTEAERKLQAERAEFERAKCVG